MVPWAEEVCSQFAEEQQCTAEVRLARCGFGLELMSAV